MAAKYFQYYFYWYCYLENQIFNAITSLSLPKTEEELFLLKISTNLSSQRACGLFLKAKFKEVLQKMTVGLDFTKTIYWTFKQS